MNTVEQTIMPFCENWYRYLKRKSDAEMLAFFKTYLKMCFEDYEPTEDDGEAYDYYWIMKPIVETRIRKIAYGKAGGRPKKDIEKDTEKVEKDTEKDKTPPLEKKRNEMKGKEWKRSEVSATHSRTRSRSTSSIQTSDDVPAVRSPSDDLPSARPSAEDIRVAAHNLGVPDWFRDYYASEMEKVGWIERSSRKAGGTAPVTRSNVVLSMRGWWDQEKKSSAARVAAEAASAAEATPVTGAGRCAVPIATTEIV